MKVKLYGIPGSHPVMSAQLMLDYKGIPYSRRDLFPVASRVLIRMLGFKGNRVPALKIDGERVQGTHDIARKLDEVKPNPRLFPANPETRRLFEEAEAWGDPFQQIPRGIIWWALKREPEAQRSFLEDAQLGIPLPTGLLIKTSGPVVWGARRLNDSYDATVQSLLADLPSALDRIDQWIADGVLNRPNLNAADFQIAPSVRLLMTFDDLAPLIESRPAGQHAKRVLPKARGASRRFSRRSGSRRCEPAPPPEKTKQEYPSPRQIPAAMETVDLQRTLVKSPPELWDELSAEQGISRWLGGEIRIYKAEAPRRLEWGGGGARGVIELEPSGWGTRVRAQASVDPPPRLGRLFGRTDEPDIEKRLSKLLDDLGASTLQTG